MRQGEVENLRLVRARDVTDVGSLGVFGHRPSIN
jgi:hypothetical protein